MDKELRYSSVEIVDRPRPASMCVALSIDRFQLQGVGRLGRRGLLLLSGWIRNPVVNLTADPKNDYELSEFIILTPRVPIPLKSCRTIRSTRCTLTAGSVSSVFPTRPTTTPPGAIKTTATCRQSIACALAKTTSSRRSISTRTNPVACGRLRPVL